MKNFILGFVNYKSVLRCTSLIVFTFLLTSCQTEDNEALPSENAELTVYDLIAGNANTDTGKRKGAPAKGDDAIAAIAIAGGFTELVQALSYVDEAEGTALVDLFLNGTDQYTVFAPTDAAFQNLYDQYDGVDDIRDLPSDLVLNVLLYHVTEGRRAANSVVPPRNYRNVETLLGVDFKVDPSAIIYAVGNTPKIAIPNISASNGIIHVIDTVLLPIE